MTNGIVTRDYIDTNLISLDEAKGRQNQLIVSSGQFLAKFIPPDYLIDGVVQRRFVYSLTGKTGTGKTAVSLLISAHVAEGRLLPAHDVEQGRVLYLAGENPDDVRMRWIAMSEKLSFGLDAIDVHFIEGVVSLTDTMSRITQEVERLGGVVLVIVDTSMAYFGGDDANSNTQMGGHARALRSLTKLPGEPCVMVCTHPVKNASSDNLVPYGGGAFINEMDGNLTLKNDDGRVELHWQGKHRGPDFAPVNFKLETVYSNRVLDSKGRQIPTIMAEPLTSQAINDLTAAVRRDEDRVLDYLAKNPRTSISGIATALGWLTSSYEPYKSKVQRALDKLGRDKLVTMTRGNYELTAKGKKEAEELETEERKEVIHEHF